MDIQQRPIGVFDSGLGGLTVVQALRDLLPAEDLVYLGDTARYPYGERTPDEVRSFAFAIAEDLVARGVKLLVVACNSATAAALDDLRREVPVPVIGVVEPGLRAAANTTRTGRVLVIGTRLTTTSRIYELAASRLGHQMQVTSLACPEFVELVENGQTDHPQARLVISERLDPMLSARVDTLVLGCTHFPLLARPLSEVVGRRITLVSSADETAFEVRDLLVHTGWSRPPEDGAGHLTVLTTGDVGAFRRLGGRFLGGPPLDVRHHVLGGSEGLRIAR